MIRPARLRSSAFLTLLAALLLGSTSAFSATALINTSFEKGLPPGADLNKLTAKADTAQAYSGRSSLRIASEPGAEWGYLVFELDGKLDFNANHAFSVWIYAEPGAKVSVYLSGCDEAGERYTSVNGVGVIKPGQWSQLSGFMFAEDWRRQDREYRFIVRVNGACWIDDLQLVSGLPETPGQVWPKLKTALHAAADKRATTLAPGGSLALDARNAALAPDTARVETTLPSGAAAVIPDEGMLVFAIDAKDDLDLTGSIQLEPDADLRPGLRVTVLSDDTVIAAPSVKAASWQAVRNFPRGARTVLAAPADLRGERPSSTVSLAPFRLSKGRHYIALAGPHIRAGGTFAKLELRANERVAEKPLYTFGLLSDTHLGFNRREYRNTLLGAATGRELEAALGQLKNEGASFAFIAGDLTDDGRRAEYMDIARIVKNAGLPVYGCIGNHDTVLADSRAAIAGHIAGLFPDGPKNTDYAFARPPVRYIVLDGSHWRDSAGKIYEHKTKTAGTLSLRKGALDWLRKTLAADTLTPTIIVSHYPFYFERGISPVSGYNRGKPLLDKSLMAVIDAAPNVVAALSGHMHHNETATRNGIVFLQNPAFAEWPDAYRVCRVYADRIEWEIRQIPNRGIIREGVIPGAALLWQLSTDPGDLAGVIHLDKKGNKHR